VGDILCLRPWRGYRGGAGAGEGGGRAARCGRGSA
jgi:hypothetical protein